MRDAVPAGELSAVFASQVCVLVLSQRSARGVIPAAFSESTNTAFKTKFAQLQHRRRGAKGPVNSPPANSRAGW